MVKKKKSFKSLKQSLKAKHKNISEDSFQQAVEFHRSGQLEKAQKIYQKILQNSPDHPECNHLFGVLCSQLGKHQEAVSFIKKAISFDASKAQYFDNLGVAYKNMNALEQAINAHQQAIQLDKKYVSAHYNLAVAYQQDGNIGEAISSYGATIALQNNHLQAHDNLAVAYAKNGEFNKAVKHHKIAHSLNTKSPTALNNYANTLLKIGQTNEAATLYQQALALAPNMVEALYNLGGTLVRLGQTEEAVEYLKKASQYSAGESCAILTQLSEAYGYNCSWDDFEKNYNKLIPLTFKQIEDGLSPDLSPFAAISLPMSAEQLHSLAQAHARNYKAISFELLDSPKARSAEKLRIGYVSPDFSKHAVGFLLKDLFSYHDKSKFEIFGYSLKNDFDEYRKNIESNCDHFVDLSEMSHLDSVKKIREDGIDLLVDLAGYTTHSRTEIFTYKPAPLQLVFLGYPGTMGTDIYDYRITHKNNIPENLAKHFSEKMVYLPETSLACAPMKMVESEITRAEYGLPEDTFVFCCFNASYRITRKIFSCWLEILKQTENSVLWLKYKNETVVKNLKSAAENYGIDPDRIIFTKFNAMSKSWLHRLADLWLDTPISAGTAGLLCLKAGLPYITINGDTAQTKTGTEILRSANLDQLVVDNEEQYIEKAIFLAKNRAELKKLKVQLLNPDNRVAVFDQKTFVFYLEKAFQKIWQHHAEGKPATSVEILKNESFM